MSIIAKGAAALFTSAFFLTAALFIAAILTGIIE